MPSIPEVLHAYWRIARALWAVLRLLPGFLWRERRTILSYALRPDEQGQQKR